MGSSKKPPRDFQNTPPFERSACFCLTTIGNFECFHYFYFERNFLKKENLFQKTGVPFLVESTKIESATFPHKTALSEANVKTNRMGSTKWTYRKERSFASNYFVFLKNLFQCKYSTLSIIRTLRGTKNSLEL